MKTTALLAYVGLVLVGAVTYMGYNFYSELALENSCEQIQGSLENVSKEVLFKKAGLLSERFGLGLMDAKNRESLANRIPEIRAVANEKGSNMNSAIDLSELETLDIILEEYLSPGGCDIFKNYVKAAQSQFISYYTVDFKRLASNLTDKELVDASMQELSKVEVNLDKLSKILTPETRCGLSNETARVLREREKDYCLALYEYNSGFVMSMADSLKASKDPYSKLYKSILINCFTPCIKREISCVEDCWLKQRQTLTGP